MKLKKLFISAFVLTFAIGIIGFVFYHSTEKVHLPTAQISLPNLPTPSIKIESASANINSLDDEPISEEEIAFEVLKPTIRKWLRGKKIKSNFTEANDESIKKLLGKEKSQLSDDEARWISNLRFEPTLIDVDGDGKNELAIRNNCASVGNCQFWLFKKKGNSYQIILKTMLGAVQTFKLKAHKTKGYFNLETKDHGDAWSGIISIYQFDGNEYKASRCFNYNYSEFKDGKLYELKKPKITDIKCVEEQ